MESLDSLESARAPKGKATHWAASRNIMVIRMGVKMEARPGFGKVFIACFPPLFWIWTVNTPGYKMPWGPPPKTFQNHFDNLAVMARALQAFGHRLSATLVIQCLAALFLEPFQFVADYFPG
jgi:hypothetical protein